jgi:uncharacterized membrane protein YraQ (UPF0718 family)
MDSSVAVMGGLLVLMAIWAFAKDHHLPLQGFRSALRLLEDVWLPLLLGFAIAGLFEVLVSRDLLIKWMGEESGLRGILVAWLVGLLLPGGPYIVFPIAATFVKQGVAAGPLITFITAKLLLSPIRTFSWEVPFLGGAFVAARNIPSVLLPPLVGLIGQHLYHLFSRE